MQPIAPDPSGKIDGHRDNHYISRAVGWEKVEWQGKVFDVLTLTLPAGCRKATRAGDVRRAMGLLVRARDLGYSDREAAASDPDLVPLAGEPAFQAWLASLGKSAAS